ncbi:MAG: hypothetical protein MI785_20430 [Kiloniellales bacterium]|nr:hypothetical protein [Kiloniellales bacterium]
MVRKSGALGHEVGPAFLLRQEGSASDGGRSMQVGGKSDHEAQVLKYFRANLGDGGIGAPDIRVSSAGDLTKLRLAE